MLDDSIGDALALVAPHGNGNRNGNGSGPEND